MPTLFDPIKAGALSLKNRIWMAPLTRARAGESRIPNDLMAEYYRQRASAGLIISEATAISPIGYGWKNAPAIYTAAQEKGWAHITRAVHEAGGYIVLQLWHMGRLSHPDFLDGQLPVSASAIAAEGVARSLEGNKPYVIPHALTKDEIQDTIDDYQKAAIRAMAAGFDGVEIHGANGYLIDQFLRDGSNVRTDEYGGSVQNRARFLIEVVEAVTAAIGPERTGLRLSPMNGYQSMHDSNLEGTFTYAAKELNKHDLAFLHVRETSNLPLTVTTAMRRAYNGVMVGNDAYDFSRAQKVLNDGLLDAVAFGVPFIANPDLVKRFKTGAPLNAARPESFYKGTVEGYTDYPFMEKAA
ncbi:MAG: alkene reductase [Micavibrio aeruginosavorus]|uniref:Alkene reductase n=1 Tax=Micavibrio aeruginosavorus TaxID=349221 RepID=A0A7T5R2U9_9BACT|nr:MAG: alkene reductase [Micavibrio aeruginosavorus]